MTILLAVSGWDLQPWLARLHALLPGREIVTPETIGDRAAVDYALSWRHPSGALADLPNLKAIFSLGAGVDHVFHDSGLPDVPIVRVVDADLRDRMSEWVVLHALIHLRQQRMYDWQQDQQIWDEDIDQPAAADIRVGILGLGALGADAARKLATIGFDVAGWSRSPRDVETIACFHGADGLEAMLARTDILVALLPLTPQTRGILNAALFAKLATDGRLGGPILLNAGRGGLQVEADILAALDTGVLKAASLDVFEVEPLPKASPLWRHPRVTISPHNAAVSTPDAIVRYIADQIAAYERGEKLRNVVDRATGY
ncbi:glyoxylate/hydroxypyruvate reductase A [Methylocapsa sp. S129]|uniref:2-hydroxyacid dehydrogenase n=1 Tax=Methylocapsa sp. S129 TaxID=1641869 RepID=UPI00131A62E1|nr:glyoxylate/hydroxypyruvate reductase A [Methylocapsa sp. S129]